MSLVMLKETMLHCNSCKAFKVVLTMYWHQMQILGGYPDDNPSLHHRIQRDMLYPTSYSLVEVREPVDGKVIGPIYEGSSSDVDKWVREHYSMLLTECLSTRASVPENRAAINNTKMYATWLDVYNALDSGQKAAFKRENGYIYPLTLQALLFIPVVKGQLAVKYSPGSIKRGYYVEPFYIITGYRKESVSRVDTILAVGGYKLTTLKEGTETKVSSDVFGGPERISGVHKWRKSETMDSDYATQLLMGGRDCESDRWEDICHVYEIGVENPPSRFQITVSIGITGGSFSGSVAIQPPGVKPDWDPGLNQFDKPTFSDVVDGGKITNDYTAGVVDGGSSIISRPVITTPSLYTYRFGGEVYFSVYSGLAGFQLSSSAVPLSRLDSLTINQAHAIGLPTIPNGTPHPIQTGSGGWVIEFRD